MLLLSQKFYFCRQISAFKVWFPELQRRFTQSILFDGLWKLGGADDDGNLDPKGFITLIELICSASKAELFYLVFERLASRLTHTGVALVDIDHLKVTYPSFERAKRDPEPNINRILRTAMETALRDRDYEERRHEAVRKRDISRGVKPSTPPSLRVPQQEKTQLRWKEWMELHRFVFADCVAVMPYLNYCIDGRDLESLQHTLGPQARNP